MNIFLKDRIGFGKVIFLVLFAAVQLTAQTSKLDSLQDQFKKALADSEKVKLALQLFEIARYSDAARAEQSALQALEISEKKELPYLHPKALYALAVFRSENGNFPVSDSLLTKAELEYNALRDMKGQAKCRMAFGNNRYDQGEFSAALNEYLKTAHLYEKEGDKKGLSGAYIWIGNVYNNGLLKHKEALEYYLRAMEIQVSLNDEAYLSFTYNNIGNAYYHLKEYEKAIDFFNRSILIKNKLGNRKGLASSYNNIANVFFDRGQYERSLDYYERSLEIRKEFDDPNGIATSFINIGNVYIKMKRPERAITYHLQALEKSRTVGYKEGVKEALTSLAADHELKGDFKNSLDYFKKASAAQDSLLNQQYLEQIATSQVKYDTERKENENKLLQKDNQIKETQLAKNRLLQIFLLIGIVLLVVVFILLFNRNKLRQKQALDAEIIRQQDLRSKAVIEAEEKERVRIARELHDGVGQQLSAAKLNVAGLQSILKNTGAEEGMLLKNALDLLDESVKEVRTVSHSMMPNALIKSGLVSAIREFIHKISSAGDLKVNLEIVGLTSRLDNTVETVLFRVLQEVVNNIIKHAKASEVSIQLVRHDNELSLLVEDNGKGFDVESKLKDGGGIGLKNIQSRIAFLNGQVFFDSYPGKGTTVNIEVPLQG